MYVCVYVRMRGSVHVCVSNGMFETLVLIFFCLIVADQDSTARRDCLGGRQVWTGCGPGFTTNTFLWGRIWGMGSGVTKALTANW